MAAGPQFDCRTSATRYCRSAVVANGAWTARSFACELASAHAKPATQERKLLLAAGLGARVADWRGEQLNGGESADFCGVSRARVARLSHGLATEVDRAANGVICQFEGCRLGCHFRPLSAALSQHIKSKRKSEQFCTLLLGTRVHTQPRSATACSFFSRSEHMRSPRLQSLLYLSYSKAFASLLCD